MQEIFHSGSGSPILIQGITDDKLTLNINGEIREIQNQLSELKSILESLQVQKIQYAEKIYNIGHINEANFGFLTGKRPFNTLLAKEVITSIAETSALAKKFLEQAASTHVDWQNQQRIRDKAKEIINYSFVGVIGIQLSKLMAIGKEPPSDHKQHKYIEKCIFIAKRSLELINFALLSTVWENMQHRQAIQLNKTEQDHLELWLGASFEHTIMDQFWFLQLMNEILGRYGLIPIEELKGLDLEQRQDSACFKICEALHLLNEKLDRADYNLLTCHDAETHLAAFLKAFVFLVNYRMASIKHIGYRQIRNTTPHYLHRYTALGIDQKTNIDAEKFKFTPETVETDSVLFYKGEDQYKNGINLFPFVIDYNALTFEQGSKICFYQTKDMMDDSLEFLFLEDSSKINIQRKGIVKEDTDFDELMMNDTNRKIQNLDHVVDTYREIRDCLTQPKAGSQL